ncbi:hypothetical protein [Helicobacter sp. 23-1045]
MPKQSIRFCDSCRIYLKLSFSREAQSVKQRISTKSRHCEILCLFSVIARFAFGKSWQSILFFFFFLDCFVVFASLKLSRNDEVGADSAIFGFFALDSEIFAESTHPLNPLRK